MWPVLARIVSGNNFTLGLGHKKGWNNLYLKWKHSQVVTWLIAQQTAACSCPSHVCCEFGCNVDHTCYLVQTQTTISCLKSLPTFSLSQPLCTCCRQTITISCNSCHSSCLRQNPRVLIYHMMNWIAAGTSGIQIINKRLWRKKTRLLFLMQVHRNKPNDMFYVCHAALSLKLKHTAW